MHFYDRLVLFFKHFQLFDGERIAEIVPYNVPFGCFMYFIASPSPFASIVEHTDGKDECADCFKEYKNTGTALL